MKYFVKIVVLACVYLIEKVRTCAEIVFPLDFVMECLTETNDISRPYNVKVLRIKSFVMVCKTLLSAIPRDHISI